MLLGAAEARKTAFSLEAFDRLELDRLFVDLREKLGTEKFDIFAAKGRAMALDQAVAIALEKSEKHPLPRTAILTSSASKV